jgi:hypothetical protein
MACWKNKDYSKIDRPEINDVLFYPRHEPVCITGNNHTKTIMIPLTSGEVISGIWAQADNPRGCILQFHGNGELACEYLDVAGIFVQLHVSFICVDYRGYGHSSGKPTATTLIEDSHDIFRYVQERLLQKNESLLVMGRSLGSAAALEIAAAYGKEINGLIIESGFAETMPLLRTLGADTTSLKIKEEDGFANIEKIKCFTNPLLIIHAREDVLITLDQGEKLFAVSGSEHKKFLKIPDAGHNDVFFTGMKNYLAAVNELVNEVTKVKIS